jgi:hypothetical protein
MINGGNIYVCSDKNLKMLKVIPMHEPVISRTFEKSFIRYNIKTFTANIIQVVW